MPKKKSQEQFIKECKEIHDSVYDYSLVRYKNNKTKVQIICLKHGVFEQLPYSHLDGRGCIKCSGKNLTNKEWIKKANKVHKNKYIYQKTIYKNAMSKVVITCTIHGDFKLTPNDHLNSLYGCQKCARNYRYSTKEWIQEAKKTHNDKYDYSKTRYKKAKLKVIITCPEHGDFLQTPNDHLNGRQGCPSCKLYSKGEAKIDSFLRENQVKFESQKKYKPLGRLRFDFYLPDYNLLLEYDGEHHFRPIRFGGISKELAQINYEKTRRSDELKQAFAKSRGIAMLRISYREFKNISSILGEIIYA